MFPVPLSTNNNAPLSQMPTIVASPLHVPFQDFIGAFAAAPAATKRAATNTVSLTKCFMAYPPKNKKSRAVGAKFLVR
jgi:hypothetical protein